MSMDSKREYFLNVWSINDITSLTLTLIILSTSLPDETLIEVSWLRAMAAIASMTLFIKVFDWLRLFEKTAFYIHLIQETLRDLSSFLILLVTTMMMFGTPIIMLNLNRTDDNKVVDEIFGFWGLDILLNQYLLALGEFSIDNFAD